MALPIGRVPVSRRRRGLALVGGLVLGASCQHPATCTQNGAVVLCNGLPRPAGSGAGAILTFTRGGALVTQQSGTNQELNNVVFGGSGAGLFVAVGAAGTIVTSADGVRWTAQTSRTGLDLFGVAYGNHQFIAVGGNDVVGAGVVLSGSSDGSAWAQEAVSDSLSLPLTGVLYADGQFVAVGLNQLLSSPDGSNWSSLPTEPSGLTSPTVDLYNAAFGNDLFVTVGTSNTSTSAQEIAYLGLIATSPDAVTWSILPNPPNYLSGITYGAGQFVAVGREGSILTSRDGATWTPQTAPQLNLAETPYLISVIYAGDQFVATGNYVGINPSTGFLLTSPDGVSWSAQTTGVNLYGVAYGAVGGDGGGGIYVAVGGGGLAPLPDAGD